MFVRAIRVTCVAAVACAALATGAFAQHTKSGTIYFDGAATANGALLVNLVVRGQSCDAAGIWEVTQGYDSNGGSQPPPTSATEVRDAILFEMTSGSNPLPAGYSATGVTVGASPGIQISSGPNQPYFDVCVDGTKILGRGIAESYVENGLTVTGDAKSKVGVDTPGIHPLGLALIALLLLGSSVLMLRRRAEA